VPCGIFEGEVGIPISLFLLCLDAIKILAGVHEKPKTLRDQVYVVFLKGEPHQQTD